MLALDGYEQLKLVRATSRSSVYEAVRSQDRREVIVKVYATEREPSFEARVEHEFRLIARLEHQRVVKALALVHSGEGLALVMARHGGVNLEEFCAGQALSVDDFLRIAVSLAEILAEVHEQRVIHRDLKPSNILIDPSSLEVVLADFGISVLLEGERSRINDPEVLEGSLPYVSPEQTGRTSSPVDFRTDLYSLGVTFYELLTGERPFSGESSLELLHAHLARRPRPPQQLRPDLPTLLSELVMKLLNKAPEQRYQSARGLATDLRDIATAWAAGETLEDFELARSDLSLSLVLPHALYGREQEVARLISAFRRAATGMPGFMLISGPPGIGKSALLNELVEPVLGRRGFIARGKFEHGKQEPFSALIRALSSLADQLLIETEEGLEQWRTRLRSALGGLSTVFVDLVPKFAPVLGEKVAEHEGEEEGPEIDRPQRRVKLAFSRLLGALARPEHPLVLALDDLQWADVASCEILEELVERRELALLILGTARDDRLERGHGLRELEVNLSERGRPIERLALHPLELPALTALVADVLSKPAEQVAPLVKIIARKTGNNPFFVRQFLLQLAELGLLRVGARGWSWDTGQIEAAALPEDSLAIMSAKLERLEPSARELLAAAAVLGGRFDVPSLVEVISSASAEATLLDQRPQVLSAARVDELLQDLVDEGLVAYVDGGFVFGHDRIREAAYSLSNEKQKRRHHLVVGRYLSAELGIGPGQVHATSEEGGGLDAKRWFELADHLGRGHGLLPLADSRGTGASRALPRAGAKIVGADSSLLVEINLRAGRRALRTGAARAALRYLELADGVLDAIERPREGLEFEVKLALGQAAGLCGDYRYSAEVLDGLLARPLEDLDYAKAVVQRVVMSVIEGQGERAIELGIEGLRRCGIRVQREPSVAQLVRALSTLTWHLRPAAIAALERRAPVSSRRLLAAMEIFVGLRNVAYTREPKLWVVLVARQVRLMARHGRHPSMPLVLMQGALVIANARNQRAWAAKLCEELSALDERVGSVKTRPQSQLLRCFVGLWLSPLREQLAQVRAAGVGLQEAGDLESATFALVMEIGMSLYGGSHLRVVEASIEGARAQVQRWGTQDVLVTGPPQLRYCELLTQGSVLEGPVFERFERLLPDRQGLDIRQALYDAQLLVAQLACVLGRYGEALALLEACAESLEREMAGTWLIPSLRLLLGVCAAAELGRQELDASEARRLRALLRTQRKSLRELVERGCALEPHAELLEAEEHALAGRLPEAGRAYEAAARHARAHQNMMLEALACERMALAVLEQGLETWALGPARRARERYRSWGAHTKVEQLDARWPWLGDEDSISIQLGSDTASDIRGVRVSSPQAASSSMRASASGVRTATGDSTNLAVDMATIFKAWQAIATDIQLSEVVDRIMQIAVENAGADRGALTLANAGRLELVAEVLAEGDTQLSFGQGLLLDELGERLPIALLRWVARTRESLVISELREDRRFRADAYVCAGSVRSVLCLPIIKRDRLIGLLYLENRLNPGGFTSQRLETLELLMSHAASALENARLYEALRASEVRWRLLVEGLPDVVVLLDRKGRLEFINLPLDRSSRRALRGRPWLEFVGEAQREQVGEALASLTGEHAGRGELVELELELELPGRGLRWYEMRVVPIVVDARLERLVVVAHDLSERRRRELETRELEAQVRQQQRLESIGTLASGVAHEINNPIQGIRGYAELIVSMPEVDAEVREFANEIEHESKRVTAIVRNLLAFSRQEAGAGMESVEAAEVIAQTLSLVRTLVRKDQIQLELDVPTDLPTIECRSQQIQQVVLNLVTNARDALNARYPRYDENKRIDLRARTFSREGVEWVAIEVEDRGGGVPEGAVENIFDPFFTTKDRDHGTGLGLSVSHGIIAEHQGQLRLENQAGEGACFIIELPTRRAP